MNVVEGWVGFVAFSLLVIVMQVALLAFVGFLVSLASNL